MFRDQSCYFCSTMKKQIMCDTMIKHSNCLAAIFLLFAAFLTACNYDKIVPEPDGLDCDAVQLTYNEQVREIIDRNCAYSGCHDGISGNPGNFTTYAGLISRISNGQFESRVLLTREMPPPNATGPTELTQDEIDDLTCWLTQGYPEE